MNSSAERGAGLRLGNKIAVITGSGRGIGRAIAQAFSANGATVVVVDLRQAEAEEAAGEIAAAGGEALGAAADITDAKQLEAVASLVEERFGRLDILVNNAGARVIAPFLDHSEEDFRRMLDINVVGHFLACKAFVPLMLRSGGRRIINTVSIASWQGRPNRVGYCAGKGGQLAFTRALAADLGHKGIRVNAIAPAMISSPLNAEFTGDDTVARSWDRENLVGRWGTPDDVASAAVFLASDEADFIHGEVITVDGGATAALVRAGELE